MMKIEFTEEHKAWLKGRHDNSADRLVSALAVSIQIPLPWLVRLRVRDISTDGVMNGFVPVTRRRKYDDICLPISPSIAELVAPQVAGKSPDDWLFPGRQDGHMAVSRAKKLLERHGLVGKCGSEQIRNSFGVAVHHANGREVHEGLRKSDPWLWSDDDFVRDGMQRMGDGRDSLVLRFFSPLYTHDDYDQGWRLVHGAHPEETPEQRLLSAQYYLRTILWVRVSEGDAIGKMLGREYPGELHELVRGGYVARYSPTLCGPDAAAAARPRSLAEFWRDVPEHLQLKRLMSFQG